MPTIRETAKKRLEKLKYESRTPRTKPYNTMSTGTKKTTAAVGPLGPDAQQIKNRQEAEAIPEGDVRRGRKRGAY